MTQRHSPEPYAEYAAIYERIGQGAFATDMAARTLEWATDTAHPRLRILDLACGTGAASMVFAAAGHDVVGIDRSLAMLALAQDKTTRANHTIRFVADDIRAFDVSAIGGPASFDLATCFFDSLNYLLKDGDLQRVCTGVGAALRPGGLFIFDLHSAYALASWEQRDEIVYDDDDLLVYNKLAYDEDRHQATGRVVWFAQRDGRWWRAEETHVERPWSDIAIRAALAAGGLRLLAALALDGTPATEETQRVVYYTQRTANA